MIPFATTNPTTSAQPPQRWTGPSWFQTLQELLVPPVLLLCALVTVLTTAGIVLVLSIETIRFFQVAEVGPLAFLFGRELNPRLGQFGILPLIWGTFLIAAGSSLIALPIGLLSAIYLSEYAPKRLRSWLKPTLELLAGVPTIVYGYLALMLVTPVLQSTLGPLGVDVSPLNAASACVVVGVMIIPMVSSLSEDVLSAVPQGLREAAYGLGATKFEVAARVVLPAGLSGVIASFILAVSRAVGETMAVTLAAGSLAQITGNVFKPTQTMTAYIVEVITGDPGAAGSPERQSLYAVGMVLFLITLTMNIVSGLVLRRYREVYQ